MQIVNCQLKGIDKYVPQTDIMPVLEGDFFVATQGLAELAKEKMAINIINEHSQALRAAKEKLREKLCYLFLIPRDRWDEEASPSAICKENNLN
jgi:hypothetical protein